MRLPGGEDIPIYRASFGNYEFVRDEEHFGSSCSAVMPGLQGELYLSGLLDGVTGVWKSIDNGVTWEHVIKQGSGMLFVDSRNCIFAKASGDWVKRSTDGGKTWETVLDLTEPAGTTVLKIATTEDADGSIYIGRYQTIWDSVIWKSDEAGAPGSFYVIYADGGLTQHVHGMAFDPYSGYIYAALDASGSAKQLMRIPGGNGGEWEVLLNHAVADFETWFFEKECDCSVPEQEVAPRAFQLSLHLMMKSTSPY